MTNVDPGSIAVIVPCYRTGERVLAVIEAMPIEVNWIFCVDDACPIGTGDLIEQHIQDPRVRVLRNAFNQGVGGATMHGYREALMVGAEVIIKLDGDGQMDPALIPRIVKPIQEGLADYVKGNRFYFPRTLRKMPWTRLVGNAALSFAAKLSTGYWSVFDPTNGFTAIHVAVLRELPLEHIAQRYFFESDMLFRLNLQRAVVVDMPMEPVYGNEVSNLSIYKEIPIFFGGHIRNTVKRIIYSYFLRDFSFATLAGLLGLSLMAFGACFGLAHWTQSIHSGVPASSGTVMLSALPLLIGIELLLSALNYDISNSPRIPIHRTLAKGPDRHSCSENQPQVD